MRPSLSVTAEAPASGQRADPPAMHAARTFTPSIPAPVMLLVMRPEIDPAVCAQSSGAKMVTANISLAGSIWSPPVSRRF